MSQLKIDHLKNLKETSSLSSTEKNTLNTHRKENSLITMIMKFLNISPTSSRQYNSAFQKTEQEVADFSECIQNYGK